MDWQAIANKVEDVIDDVPTDEDGDGGWSTGAKMGAAAVGGLLTAVGFSWLMNSDDKKKSRRRR